MVVVWLLSGSFWVGGLVAVVSGRSGWWSGCSGCVFCGPASLVVVCGLGLFGEVRRMKTKIFSMNSDCASEIRGQRNAWLNPGIAQQISKGTPSPNRASRKISYG